MKADPPFRSLQNTVCEGLGEVMATLDANSQILQLFKLMLRSGLTSAAWLMQRMVDGLAPWSAEPRRQDTEPEPGDPGNDPSGENGDTAPVGEAHNRR